MLDVFFVCFCVCLGKCECVGGGLLDVLFFACFCIYSKNCPELI